jgi:hypothetical protein
MYVQFVQAGNRVFYAIVLDDPQPFMKGYDYAVIPAAVTTSNASPICNVPPRNKLHLTLHYGI